ncbi:hypothetical protein [Kaistia granuli]|uniref:hypothetical protein n=1 Tax=Kaistia granuli TaxID=363259 RepID=UPI000370479D|nr:hypothetical protein [Kaistia granuli]
MKDELKQTLDAAFQRHEASKRAATEAKQVAETKAQTFLRDFIEARDTIIRPAMEEIGEYVRNQGYVFEVSTEDDKPSPDGRGRSIAASIRLTFLLGDRHRPSYEYPGLSVICEKQQQKVRFHESTMSPGRGGHAGPAGEATLNSITKEMVQEKISKVVAEIFR